MNIGDKIKNLRREKNWSQAQLGLKIGIHEKHVSRYERGVSLPSTEALQKMANLFGVSIDYLLTEETKNMASTGIKDKELLAFFEEADKLGEEDKKIVKGVLDAILFKNRIQKLSQK